MVVKICENSGFSPKMVTISRMLAADGQRKLNSLVRDFGGRPQNMYATLTRMIRMGIVVRLRLGVYSLVRGVEVE